MNAFLLSLVEKYTSMLRHQASEELQQIVNADDYIPMTVDDFDEYDRIIEAGYYTPAAERDSITLVMERGDSTSLTVSSRFPLVFPFSQMYPMCCMEIRNFIQQVYAAPDDHLHRIDTAEQAVINASTKRCEWRAILTRL